jgi:hypothetical protein
LTNKILHLMTLLKHRHNLSAPQRVNGRNSDNTLIKKYLGWAPGIRLRPRKFSVVPEPHFSALCSNVLGLPWPVCLL